MIKKLTFLFCIISSFKAISQTNYAIRYERYNYVDTNGNTHFPKLYGTLYVIGDTLTVYTWDRKKNYISTIIDVSKKEAHHGVVNPLKNNLFYEVVHNNNGDFDIEVKKDSTEWVIDSSKPISILNMRCYSATKISLHSLVWYTPNEKVSAGPGIYFGLPGLVLAAYDLKHNIVIMASKILSEFPQIVKLRNSKVITHEQFKKMQETRKDNFDNRIRIRVY